MDDSRVMVRDRVLIEFGDGDIRSIGVYQKSRAVECCGQTWDDCIRLSIGASGKGSRTTAEDVTCGGWCEGDAVLKG